MPMKAHVVSITYFHRRRLAGPAAMDNIHTDTFPWCCPGAGVGIHPQVPVALGRTELNWGHRTGYVHTGQVAGPERSSRAQGGWNCCSAPVQQHCSALAKGQAPPVQSDRG